MDHHDDHHGSIEDQLTSRITKDLTRQFGSEAYMQRTLSRVMMGLANTLRVESANLSGAVDVSTFLTRPKLLSNGAACIALLDTAKYSKNAYRLITLGYSFSDLQAKTWVLYREPGEDLTQFVPVQPVEDERKEISRQVNLIMEGSSENRMFTVMFFSVKIENYDYYEEPAQSDVASFQSSRPGVQIERLVDTRAEATMGEPPVQAVKAPTAIRPPSRVSGGPTALSLAAKAAPEAVLPTIPLGANGPTRIVRH